MTGPATGGTAVPGARSRKGDRRRAAILATAARLLATRPLATVGIDELAAGAGINRSTFYFYFDSREAVVEALAGEIGGWAASVTGDRAGPYGLVGDGGDGARDGDGGGDEPYAAAIPREIAAHLEMWHRHGPVLRAVVDARDHSPTLGAYWRAQQRRVVRLVADRVERERATGRTALGDPPALDLAGVLVTMTERACYDHSRRTRSRSGDDRLAAALTAVWCRSIYGTDVEAVTTV